ncbi:class I SAM-dependent methyltransferase [Aliidiomarina maris]|uniref:Methyltransferase n=1 Tax=Aliidiomarina maris TaxID=531312 RepID=A0A327WYL5_9GAMM|nr:class I SAM-dependent methyltransferase [Aliidiomarina maris]RAJ98271.1 putative methyltransferase [Aliidiomarina maris]RUO24895.1 methyltransferase [Aliidiomarina maris]
MNKSFLSLSILACLIAGPSFAMQQEEPPVNPAVVEENEPEELDVVRDVDDEGSDLEQRDFNLDMDISPMTLREAVDAPSRRPQSRDRDGARNPYDTLEFFGIEPNMTVVEVWPGAGWYTEILAPLLAAEGTLYAAHFPGDSESDFFRTARGNYQDFLRTSNIYANVQITEFNPGSHHEIAPEGSADMVLTFRNLHNWYMRSGGEGLEQAMDAFYTALRPGGVLGMVDHRLPEDRDDEEAESSGYIKQSWVVSAAEAAGFELVDESDINANPDDTADYSDGVWALPPTLRGGDPEGRFTEIGESGRFTLKFRKPE